MPKERILVVEDEVIIALDIQRTLVKMGYEVPEFVTSAESALDRIAVLQPDLVLMDIHLSGEMDGIAAADEIRRRDRLPVVFLTAHSDEATLNRAKITQPYGYVLKPFDERELQIAIEIALYRHGAEMKLRQMERWLGTTLKSIGDGIITTDKEGKIVFMNRMAEVLTGWPQSEVFGRPFEEILRLIHTTTRTRVGNLVERVLAHGVIIDLSPDTALINRKEDDIPIDKSAAPIRDENGNVTGVVIVFRELTARKYVEEKLRYFAAHDVLTGLPNQVLLAERLNIAFEQAKRYPDYHFALLFIDLDRFSMINDIHGEVFGDLVLAAVAQRLKENLRGVDTLARLGGDEFVILLNHIEDLLDVTHAANRILRNMTHVIIVDGQKVFVSANIGVVLSDPFYQRTEDILYDGASALKLAKVQERENRHLRVFNTSQHEQAMHLLQLETELNLAIERKEFRISYQPIVSLADGDLQGFEAILCWEHPEQGLLAPANFLALAEKTGIVAKIGKWLLDEACRQLRAWQQRVPANIQLSLAVKLPPTQLLHPGLKDHVAGAVTRNSLEASRVMLEIPEDAIVADPAATSRILAELAELGALWLLDDFSPVDSSLGMLQHPSLHGIKIAAAEATTKNSAIARSVLSLANTLGIKVIADGLETAEQAEQFLDWGCRYGQGYPFSAPLTAEEVDRLLKHSAGLTG